MRLAYGLFELPEPSAVLFPDLRNKTPESMTLFELFFGDAQTSLK